MREFILMLMTLFSGNSTLNVYYPHFSEIQLVTETMPSKEDESVIFTAAASFTGNCLENFTHSNIAGHHVSNGIVYKGYDCAANTGMFMWSPSKGYTFIKCSHKESLNILNKYKPQTAFSQHLVIYNNIIQGYCFPATAVNYYRVLAEKDRKLCIIDCKKALSFSDFVHELKKYNVSNAIYLDMGGWAYSWYRNDNNKVVELYSGTNKYATNWITFYKKCN